MNRKILIVKKLHDPDSNIIKADPAELLRACAMAVQGIVRATGNINFPRIDGKKTDPGAKKFYGFFSLGVYFKV